MIEIKGQVVPERVTEETDIFNRVYNPDVLLCLANLSNDEVFTPPEVANQMLDMLPQELFEDPNTTFLDPACKSGVFLREIAKRLIKGLEDKIPDLEERIDHICKHQLYGIAITELTSLLSRRSVYCSKYPNGPFSISRFDNVEGNIRFKTCRHEWEGPVKWKIEGKKQERVWRKCKWCGASEEQYGDEKRTNLEAHAYEILHTKKPEEIFNMKFDVIISNPPYQLSDGGNSASASPLYHLFVQQSMKLHPRYLSMIIPARWYAGGKGLDNFRKVMLNEIKISNLVDIANSADCFPGVNIAGGVCYFLWDNQYSGKCKVANMKEGSKVSEEKRALNEFDYFVRDNLALSVIHKVLARKEKLMNEVVYSRNYFNISTTAQGGNRYFTNSVKVLTSKGDIYLGRDKVADKNIILNKYKVVITYAMSGGNKPSSDGKYQILSSLKILDPNEACSETYLILGVFDKKEEAENMVSYMKGQLPRFLLLQALTSIHITKDKFCFVPMQDFTKTWTDEDLYKKYGITEDEIAFIDSMIRPMELEG